MRTITLPFHSIPARIDAAQFLAELVRQGVTFKAETTGDGIDMVITFTGGY